LLTLSGPPHTRQEQRLIVRQPAGVAGAIIP
jgi:hypothetical protein